jgi:hypothetical protein
MSIYPGLRCPVCGSWYSADPIVINSGMEVGEVCGNQAMTGPQPELCSPEHPCEGRLEPAGKTHIDFLNDREAIKVAFEGIDGDDLDE